MANCKEQAAKKAVFLQELPAEDLRFLQESSPFTRKWCNMDKAKNIIQKSRDRGLYGLNTSPGDLLAGLRNAALKLPSPPCPITP